MPAGVYGHANGRLLDNERGWGARWGVEGNYILLSRAVSRFFVPGFFLMPVRHAAHVTSLVPFRDVNRRAKIDAGARIVKDGKARCRTATRVRAIRIATSVSHYR